MFIRNKNILVFGLKESGEGAISLLKQKKANVFIYDDNKEVLSNYLNDNTIKVIDTINLKNLIDNNIRLVVVSPAIDRRNISLQIIDSLFIPIISEIELGYLFCKNKIVAITGTNGKTTTCSILGKMIQNKYGVDYTFGNIGRSFSRDVLSLKRKVPVTLEVSSFQLEWVNKFKPYIAVFLNISPDHLIRHITFKNYLNEKKKIYKNCNKNDYVVLNADDEIVNKLSTRSKVYYFSLNKEVIRGAYLKGDELFFKDKNKEIFIINVKDIKLLGNHNIQNILASIICAFILKIDNSIIVKTIKEFLPLPHRIEKCGEYKEVEYINDSKATNINSTLTDIKAIKKDIYLLVGGSDKGENFDDLISGLTPLVKHLFIYGATKNAIITSCKKLNYDDIYTDCKDMFDAVDKAKDIATKNSVIMLSPSCASFDAFKNYEDRGDQFKNYIRKINNDL